MSSQEARYLRDGRDGAKDRIGNDKTNASKCPIRAGLGCDFPSLTFDLFVPMMGSKLVPTL